ncbi:glycosyltransferase [Afipia clevelandensis]|uniref:Spore protein YkvP/CgeB glycosyl transferase-like domain-containing protein n=1 Tax=Afipia clevelandensis ATCC 49720 TaxID=883079 RepID=K8NZ58_9BRAD|nr:glycosyltransferase [Afipia clevelandensis]EKS35622.1 hypothetical protein HMPREF9696_01834 [Afipia clevelandensis ATCC 49720]
MKILYIDIDARFLVPTRNLVPAMLAQAADVCLFGPGYVSSAQLVKGLDAFIDDNGPFDVAITNTHVLFSDVYGEPMQPEAWNSAYEFSFPGRDLLLLAGIARAFERLSIPRIGLFLESDFFYWTEREIGAIRRRTDFVMGFGTAFSPLRKDMPSLAGEKFAGNVTDSWASYVRENPERVASVLHFVAAGEACFTGLSHRPHPWSVVGIQYVARRIAGERLREAGLTPVSENPLRRGMGLAKRLRLIRKEPKLVQRWLNLDFNLRLQKSRYAYTCGSGIDMPIRKFFEIPSAGAVLVCKPFSGFAAAGFQHGENCVVCEPEDVVEVHRWLESDPDRAQRIADAGRTLVLRQHSVTARARQFAKTFAAIADGSFAGGEWIDGEYVVHRKSAVAHSLQGQSS